MEPDTNFFMTDNRREWLRIDDRLLMEYWRVGEGPSPVGPGAAQSTEKAVTDFVTKPTSDLLASTPCEEAEPVLVPWLKKIDWVLELLLKGIVQVAPHGISMPQLTEVNISAGGVSFQSPRRFEEGDLLEIRLILPPFSPIQAKAEVIRSDAGSVSGEFSIAVKFTDLSQDEQERLIRHILSVQARQLRNRQVAVE